MNVRHFIDYDDNGDISAEQWMNEDGVFHREDGPAVVWYYYNGQIERERWLINGETHRIDGPAFINYSIKGTIISEQYSIMSELNWLSKEEWEQLPEVIEYKLNQLINKELL
jgi:hypothetical protein